MKILSPLRSLCALALFQATAFAEKAYDVVIVGSGPGGLVAAEYLSRDRSVSVLVLEAGLPSLAASGGTDYPSYAAAKKWTKFDIPGEFDITIYNPDNEKYRVDWINGPYMWLGKLVGGCSSINAMLYFRPPNSFVTNSEWPATPARVAQLMTENEAIHGATDVPSPDGKHYNQEAYKIAASAFGKLGYTEKTLNDQAARNAKSKSYGHAPYAVKDGFRDSPAKAFWNQMKSRANVKLVTSAMVNHIQQSGGKATGVVYNDDIEVPLTARGAVIMAAGALNTPKVLISSGVGPSTQLALLKASEGFPGAKSGDSVVNENVGKHLFDSNVAFGSFSHPQMKSFRYKDRPTATIEQYMTQNQSGAFAGPGPVLISYETYDVNGRSYDFQTTMLTAGFGEFYQNNDSFTASMYVKNPEARDVTEFNAEGKWSAFTQNATYVAKGNDLAALQNYATRVVGALEADGATFLSKASNQTVAEWVASSWGSVTHHFGGSCYASLNAKDTKRCADEKLRVVGTNNIFIGDASAMREGTVNPYGFIMYIGREVGEHVKTFLSEDVAGDDDPFPGVQRVHGKP